MEKVKIEKRRVKAFQMLLTEQELQELAKISNDAHLSKAAYIRVKIFDGKVN